MSTPPDKHQNKLPDGSRRYAVFGSVLLGVLVLVSSLFVWAYMSKGSPNHSLPGIPSPSNPELQLQLSPSPTSSDAGEAFNPLRHSPSTPTRTLQHPTSTSGSASGTSSSSSGSGSSSPAITSFRFTAAGDYAQTSYTTANLSYIAHSGASFHLGLGDFNYNLAGTSADGWSSYVKSNLPPNFPFEIVPGNEDVAYISNYIADLPDHIGNISGIYGQEYSFDFPVGAPLARFIMITPGAVLSGYSYSMGSPHYNWVAQQIDGARNAGIPWVIVGMHEFCIAMGTIPCTIGTDLENLLISKKVDLVLQGHSHDYQAGKQLALNGTSCPGVQPNAYNPACVVNASANMTKGAGTVFVITGTGGDSPLFSLNPASFPEAGYFRTWMAGNSNATWGVSRFTVSATQITGQFIGVSGAGFSDSFTIHT